MAALFRATAVLTGFTGSPGYLNLYAIHSDPPSTGAQALVENVMTFLDSIYSIWAEPVRWSVQSDVAVLEDTTGAIEDYIPTSPPAQAFVPPAGAYSAPSGAFIDWLTTTVVNSRRVMGRSFIVPAGASVYQADGTLTATAKATLEAGSAAYLAAAGPTKAVWSRPFTPPPDSDAEPRLGSTAPITARRVPDKAAVLRSRRD